ncbi:hypothetical protein AB0I28_31210 [Phytomonospora sp. NPDC050363]|uniref:hypothetical protein n=1 Tax=Phytomonospora sp. NPDC050363 TaxID=3155642 RepID=UPI0033E5F4BA
MYATDHRPGPPAPPPPGIDRRMLRWFIAAGAAIVAVGLVVVIVLAGQGALPGDEPVSADDFDAPDEDLPPLAELCPPLAESPKAKEAKPPPEGERTVDETSGISYAAYAEPWLPWRQTWDAGELEVAYRTGQYFVTEEYSGGDYLASILSGSVAARVNDGADLDLECTAHQVAADVRVSYYPQPNEMEVMRDELVDIGGRPAWLMRMRFTFDEPGLSSKDELVGLALIDVGRPEAAVLYVSIPGSHGEEFDWVVDDVLDSVRPA